ncbi:hypothetical protein RCL1_002321 [Eukaryota sp. TZLM3-RCL]
MSRKRNSTSDLSSKRPSPTSNVTLIAWSSSPNIAAAFDPFLCSTDLEGTPLSVLTATIDVNQNTRSPSYTDDSTLFAAAKNTNLFIDGLQNNEAAIYDPVVTTESVAKKRSRKKPEVGHKRIRLTEHLAKQIYEQYKIETKKGVTISQTKMAEMISASVFGVKTNKVISRQLLQRVVYSFEDKEPAINGKRAVKFPLFEQLLEKFLVFLDEEDVYLSDTMIKEVGVVIRDRLRIPAAALKCSAGWVLLILDNVSSHKTEKVYEKVFSRLGFVNSQ